MDVEEISLIRAEPVWQGVVSRSNELILQNGKVLNECERHQPDNVFINDDQHGSIRSIGVGINSDAADIGSGIHRSLVRDKSERNIEYFHDQDDGIGGSRNHDANWGYSIKSVRDKTKRSKQTPDRYILAFEKSSRPLTLSHIDGGFSFAPPDSDRSLWSSKGNATAGDDSDNC